MRVALDAGITIAEAQATSNTREINRNVDVSRGATPYSSVSRNRVSA